MKSKRETNIWWIVTLDLALVGAAVVLYLMITIDVKITPGGVIAVGIAFIAASAAIERLKRHVSRIAMIYYYFAFISISLVGALALSIWIEKRAWTGAIFVLLLLDGVAFTLWTAKLDRLDYLARLFDPNRKGK